MSSVLANEVNQFNRLADTWWDTSGPMWPLHKLNALRVPFILRHVRSHFSHDGDLSGLKVLDIGCGAGILSESLARTKATMVGVDAAERNIAIATQHARANDLAIDYRHGTVEALDSSESFDIVLNMEVVEHVADVEQFLTDCAAKVRPGGLMFVATINRTLYSAVTAILGAEYILGLLPKGTHQWHQFVKPAEVNVVLQQNAFTVLEQTGVAVNPIRKSMSLSRYCGANYMLVARKEDR